MMMKLKITATTFVVVDETDKTTWNPENGTPAEITHSQLDEGEIGFDDLAESAAELWAANGYVDDSPNTFEVEVVDD
jgi:hypothetical protein